jgi:ubiquinone/menaquinone biosynthesis C-methylase UbiE
MHNSQSDWKSFRGNKIPSTLKLHPLFFQNTKITDSIIDIGCGRGVHCQELLQKGYQSITGIDLNNEALKIAEKNIQEIDSQSKNRVRFQCSDAADTGFLDNSFNIGIMQAFLTTLTTLEIRLKVLRETHRILHNDGYLYMAVFMQTWHNPYYYQRYLEGEKETGEIGSFIVRDEATNEYLYQAHHFSERELVDLLHQTNFEIQQWIYDIFTTRSGKQVNGAKIWAKRK